MSVRVTIISRESALSFSGRFKRTIATDSRRSSVMNAETIVRMAGSYSGKRLDLAGTAGVSPAFVECHISRY
jgi:hypothetical protein